MMGFSTIWQQQMSFLNKQSWWQYVVQYPSDLPKDTFAAFINDVINGQHYRLKNILKAFHFLFTSFLSQISSE